MNGIIYKITCNITEELYIGSTTKSLRQRIANHVLETNNCSSKQIIERQNFRFETLATLDFPEKNDQNKSALLQLEAMYIKNNVCVNKNLPYRTEKEKKQMASEYYQMYNDQFKRTMCYCGGFYTTPSNQNKHNKTKKHLDFVTEDESE